MPSPSESGLLRMLACELFDVPAPAMDGADWTAILALAQKHAVTPLLFGVAKRLRGIPADVLQVLRSAAISAACSNERTRRAEVQTIELLEKHSIRCVVLKGTSVAVCYPHPDQRRAGDVDLLIDAENAESVDRLLTQNGYRYWAHEHGFHRSYFRQDTDVEIHSAVSDFPRGEKAQKARCIMQDALAHVHRISVDGASIPVLDAPYQLLSLLVHMERHMTGGEIGLRQICDWAVSSNRFMDEACAETMRACGLYRFASLLSAVSNTALGMPVSWQGETISAEMVAAALTHFLAGANLHAEAAHSMTKMLQRGNARRENDHSLLNNYISNVNEKARREYSVAKHPWTLPFFWLFYPLRWRLRMLLGKSERVPMGQAVSMARSDIALYEQLKLYR